MSDKIRFSELVEKIAEETGASKQLIHDLLRETVDLAKEGLAEDGRISLTGLGHFKLKWHDARQGINPQTGETIEIPAQNRVHFKPEAALRDYINRQYKHLKPEIIDDETKAGAPLPEEQPESSKTTEAELPTKPVDQQAPATEPISESRTAPIEEKRKPRRISFWLWLISLFIILLIIIFLWPARESPEPVVEEIQVSKGDVKETAPVTAAPTPATTSGPTEGAVPENESAPPKIAEKTGTTEKESPQSIEQSATSKADVTGERRTIKPGDRLWDMADDYYAMAYLWPNIYRANLSELKNPDELLIGIDVLLPYLEGKIGSLTAKDSANIATGYIQAYLAYKKIGKADAYKYLWVAEQYHAKALDQFKHEINDEDMKLVRQFDVRMQAKQRENTRR